MKYEYTTVDFSTPACTGMEITLNKLGKDGWELISVCPKDISEYGLTLITAFFKRGITEK